MTPAEFIDDPGWADFLPEDAGEIRKRPVPAHEDCTSLDPDRIAAGLRRGGVLGGVPGYEERPGQIEMCRAVVEAFDARTHLAVEAGTGVGKSLAYLLPAVHWAALNDTTVVVATATRNLQDQLVKSDIPKAIATLGAMRRPFRAAVLKGRGNYLCLHALADFFAAGFWTMSDSERAEMPHLIDWLKKTPDGDLDGYSGLPRALLTRPGEECTGRRCRYRSRCFVYRARRRAFDADLVVVNHALALTDAADGASSLLPAYGRLIVDEAHNLEQAATDCFSSVVSAEELARTLSRLFRDGGSSRRPRGVIADLERQIGRSAGAADLHGILELAGRVRKAARELTRASDGLLARVAGLLAPSIEAAGPVRHRVAAGGVREYAVPGGLFKPYGEEWNEAALASALERFERAAATLVAGIHEVAARLRDREEGDSAAIAGQFDAVAQSVVDYVNSTHFTLSAAADTHTFWVERSESGSRRHGAVRAVAAPLSVAEMLDKVLYRDRDSVVLCSATLRVGGDFRYMLGRLGARERFATMVAASPFDYLSQALTMATDFLGEPQEDPRAYAGALAAFVGEVIAAMHGRTLVLFTSFEAMRATAALARPLAERAGVRLIVQGDGPTRAEMAEELRRAENPVALFGAQSFWEGVDIAGAALSCVIIARLPFPQVGDPVREARGERIAREGGSAFRDYALPEAVVRFRQGFGRLIRTRGDRGVAIVADARIVRRNYGAIFRRSLPAPVGVVKDAAEALRRIGEFMEA